jgi:hypothetical protein
VAVALLAAAGAYLFYIRTTQPLKKPLKVKADTVPDIEDLNPFECGFDRPLEGQYVEMHGDVKPLQFHLLLSTAAPPTLWNSDPVESSAMLGTVQKGIGKFPKSRKGACHMYYDPKSSATSHTMLWYPKRVALSGVSEGNIEALLVAIGEDNLDLLPEGVAAAPLKGTDILVCCHRQRDARCGYCGPVLVAEFEKELEDPKYKAAGEVRVHKVSHVGGHKYAGNVLVYGPKTLDWYAYVRQTDVAEVCEKVIMGGQWIPRIWRGRVGVDAEESDRLKQQCLAAHQPSGGVLSRIFG